MKPSMPDFRSPQVLGRLTALIISFYGDRCLDAGGGFDPLSTAGTVTPQLRHLLSSARTVGMYAKAAYHFPMSNEAAAWRDAAAHGLAFLREMHRDPATGGYAWILRWADGSRQVLDPSIRCEGLAWVMQAHAHALRMGMASARDGIEESFVLMEQRFWKPVASLYTCHVRSDERLHQVHEDQRVSMHACDALLAAHDATGDSRYLQRAAQVADHVTQKLAWEYGNAERWSELRADPHHPGFHSTGHLAQWVRLLMAIERAQPEPAEGGTRVHRARELFAAMAERAWDRQHGGLTHHFAPDGSVFDSDKHGWIHAEAIAAAAVLGERTAEGHYWDWYDRLWAYCWTHFIDHEAGGWRNVFPGGPDAQGRAAAGTIDVTGYHAVDACCEAQSALTRRP